MNSLPSTSVSRDPAPWSQKRRGGTGPRRKLLLAPPGMSSDPSCSSASDRCRTAPMRTDCYTMRVTLSMRTERWRTPWDVTTRWLCAPPSDLVEAQGAHLGPERRQWGAAHLADDDLARLKGQLCHLVLLP